DSDIDLEDYPNLRGVYGFDGNFEQGMIRDDPDRVVAALADLKGLKVAPFNIERTTLDDAFYLFAVFRLQGIDWTYLVGQDRRQSSQASFYDQPPERLTEEDLIELSKRLRAPAIRFGVSDIAGACGYTYMESGRVVEAFESADGMIVRAESTRREIPKH